MSGWFDDGYIHRWWCSVTSNVCWIWSISTRKMYKYPSRNIGARYFTLFSAYPMDSRDLLYFASSIFRLNPTAANSLSREKKLLSPKQKINFVWKTFFFCLFFFRGRVASVKWKTKMVKTLIITFCCYAWALAMAAVIFYCCWRYICTNTSRTRDTRMLNKHFIIFYVCLTSRQSVFSGCQLFYTNGTTLKRRCSRVCVFAQKTHRLGDIRIYIWQSEAVRQECENAFMCKQNEHFVIFGRQAARANVKAGCFIFYRKLWLWFPSK